jgi:hypothetical protein
VTKRQDTIGAQNDDDIESQKLLGRTAAVPASHLDIISHYIKLFFFFFFFCALGLQILTEGLGLSMTSISMQTNCIREGYCRITS